MQYLNILVEEVQEIEYCGRLLLKTAIFHRGQKRQGNYCGSSNFSHASINSATWENRS